MKTIDGTRIYTELAEVVHPKHTALLVIDVQGNWDKLPGAKGALKQIANVLDAARKAGVLVIYFRNRQLNRHLNISAPYLRLLLQKGYDPKRKPLPQLPGSAGLEIVPCVAPRPDEILISKPRASAFIGTPLETLLRSNHIESLVLVGGSTDWCVEATLWDTTGRDYYAVVLEDAVAGPRPDGHKAALKQHAMIADVAHARDVIKIWRRRRRKTAARTRQTKA